MSARSDMPGLVRLLPLDVVMPTTRGLTMVLPPEDAPEGGDVFGELVTVAGIEDQITVMASLAKPKKVGCPMRTLRRLRQRARLAWPVWVTGACSTVVAGLPAQLARPQ